MAPPYAGVSVHVSGTVSNPSVDVFANRESAVTERSTAATRAEVIMATAMLTIELVLAAAAGGMLGAALGGLPAFSLAGIVITIGEIANVGVVTGDTGAGESELLGTDLAPLDAVGATGAVGFGPVLGPHVAFAGGVAAAAYLGRKETFDTGFRYHQAKNIRRPLGSDPEVLLVGGAFGLLGAVVARLTASAALPVDPVMLSLVVSGFVHRLAFGYPLVGRVRDLQSSVLDMSPFERGEYWGQEDRETAQGTGGRHVVEPWLPDHYEWGQVAGLGVAVGIASGYLALVTGSVFLAFGITAASLLFLSAGLYAVPVTHHMALPASIAAWAVLPEVEPIVALALAGVFGLLGAVLGELAQRTLYAHADTHLDPAAVSIVLTSLLLAVLAAVGPLDPGRIPYPGL
jgi:hypothetical protein